MVMNLNRNNGRDSHAHTFLLYTTTLVFSLICFVPILIHAQRPVPRKDFSPPPVQPVIPIPIPVRPVPVVPIPVPPVPVVPIPVQPLPVIPIPIVTPRPPWDGHPKEHPPLVREIYRDPPKMIWNCKLERRPCELKNGVNFIPFKNNVRYGEKDTIIADLDQSAQILHQRLPQPEPKILFPASRLWTKNYFPARYSNACLYLSYMMSGQHLKTMKVMQRNQEDVCVYSAESSGYLSSVPNWRDAQIQLDLRYGDARFVLDFEYDLPGADDYRTMGSVEIKNFSIAYGNCARNDGNECDFPHVVEEPIYILPRINAPRT